MLNSMNTFQGNTTTRTSLRHFISRLIKKSYKTALTNQSLVMNKVGDDLMIDTCNFKLIALISELLETVVVNSRKGEIYITAERYSDMLILSLQERNNFNGYALAYTIGTMEPEAITLGGHIAINGPQKKVTTISFSFPNQPIAA